MESHIKEHPEWKEMMAQYRGKEYGTFIPHDEIEKILNCSRFHNSNKYYGFVEKWKREMLKTESKQIECVHSSGYKIIEPQEFRASVSRQLRFAHRRNRKAGEISVKTPLERLSPEEKQKAVDTAAIVTQILHFSKATNKKIKQIDRKVDQLLLDVGKALDVAD
jgi:hypothetical protein